MSNIPPNLQSPHNELAAGCETPNPSEMAEMADNPALHSASPEKQTSAWRDSQLQLAREYRSLASSMEPSVNGDPRLLKEIARYRTLAHEAESLQQKTTKELVTERLDYLKSYVKENEYTGAGVNMCVEAYESGKIEGNMFAVFDENGLVGEYGTEDEAAENFVKAAGKEGAKPWFEDPVGDEYGEDMFASQTFSVN